MEETTALHELDAGVVPSRGSTTEQTVKDCLALHWARSHSFKPSADQAWERVRRASADDLARRPELLARAFAQQTGRDYPSPQDLADVNDDLHRGPDSIVDGRHFSEWVRHYIVQTQAKFADRSDHARTGDGQAARLNDWQASVRRTHLVRRPSGDRRP